MVQYLDICDGNMQEGSFRIDANISLHQRGEPFGTRAEIKNINSFRFLEKALEYEVLRQTQRLQQGLSIVQETRLYDAEKNETRSMRTKEEANDYRYFPDPDLLPVYIDSQQLQRVRDTLPELPDRLAKRFQEQYGISDYDARIITADKACAQFFETLCQRVGCQRVGADYKLCANWLMGDYMGYLNKQNLYFHESPVAVETLAQLLLRVIDGTISGKIAKEIFDTVWHEGGQVDDIIDSKGLRQITDDVAIESLIDEVLNDHHPTNCNNIVMARISCMASLLVRQ